jgi:transcriptional repressor NF-X1
MNAWFVAKVRYRSNHFSRFFRIFRKNIRSNFPFLLVVKRHVATWSCRSCYKIFHIYCIKRWRQKSLENEKDAKWRCPACRADFDKEIEYRCFCNKAKDPEYDPYNLPHSCGELCAKKREGTECPHPCNLLCHPGPCPPCSAYSPVKHCYCGKTDYRTRCSDIDKGRTCGAVCDKTLNCGRHQCRDVCHEGRCKRCTQDMSQTCYCGQVTETRVCGSEEFIDHSQGAARYFSCKKICSRTLDCGNHTCQEVCHSGPCRPCALQPALCTTCPCGKSSLASLKAPARKSCLDPVAECKQVCGKLLKCGRHNCKDQCHNGPCKPCLEEVLVPCRCGGTSKPFVCGEVYPDKIQEINDSIRCDRICHILRSCGRHQCSQRCCPAMRNTNDPEGIHVCKLVCNKKLNCGVHRCQAHCHKGRCERCLEAIFDDVACACGKSVLQAPVACGTPPPVCTRPCTKPQPCGHKAVPHGCHYGDCPPCVALTEKRCMGGHCFVKNVACSKTEVSCNRVCGKPVHCGLHNCSRICHAGPCEVPLPVNEEQQSQTDATASSHRPSCGQVCNIAIDCGHGCPTLCHPGQPCPIVQCNQKVKIACDCGRITAEVPCYTTKDRRSLTCNEVCELEKRNKKLAEAFGKLSSGSYPPPNYSDAIKQMTKACPQFVRRVEKQLDEFMSRTAMLRFQFSPMDRIQRKLVHELAEQYHLDSESVDREPQRAVQVVKRKDSRIPTVLLSVAAGVSKMSLSPNASCALHLYDLTANVKTEHMIAFLSSFTGQYSLHWIDDSNCLVVFEDDNLARQAMNQLNNGVFKVKFYHDINPDQDQLVLSAPSYSKIAKPKTPVAPNSSPKPWEVDNNPFKLLDQAAASKNYTTPTNPEKADFAWEYEDDQVKKAIAISLQDSETKEQEKTEVKESVAEAEDWQQLADSTEH